MTVKDDESSPRDYLVRVEISNEYGFPAKDEALAIEKATRIFKRDMRNGTLKIQAMVVKEVAPDGEKAMPKEYCPACEQYWGDPEEDAYEGEDPPTLN